MNGDELGRTFNTQKSDDEYIQKMFIVNLRGRVCLGHLIYTKIGG
jgi:hypothetical protein